MGFIWIEPKTKKCHETRHLSKILMGEFMQMALSIGFVVMDKTFCSLTFLL